MSIEMEIPKVLWLKNNMPKKLFDRCKFYDLTDALTHLATGSESRSFCSVVCKQGFVPVGVDGSVKGWQEDFLKEIGLEDLCKDNFKRMGGVDNVVGPSPPSSRILADVYRMAVISRQVISWVPSARRQPRRWGSCLELQLAVVSSMLTLGGLVLSAPKCN